MRKILVAQNAQNLNTASIDFGAYIANLTKSKVTGVFLEQEKEAFLPAMEELYGAEENTSYKDSVRSEAVINENISLFKDACTRRLVNYSIHRDKGNPTQELLRESRFADVIITSSEVSFHTEKMSGTPSIFVKELLTRSECPVIIAPFRFDTIDEIVFAYDGSKSSVHAMKQFTYLFPELEDTEITLLQITADELGDFTEKEKVKEWLMMHYNEVHVEILHGSADAELFRRLLGKKNKFLVMGAYGRSFFLSHSTADLVLKTIDTPVFITHC